MGELMSGKHEIGAPFTRVKEIPEEDDAARAGAGEQGVEPSKAVGRRPTGHRDPCRAEGCCLAKVRIGDEQRRGTPPVRSALGEELQLFTTHDRIRGHPAARSSASCIFRTRSASDSEETRSRARSTSSGNASGGVRRGSVTTTRAFATRCSVRPSRLLSS